MQWCAQKRLYRIDCTAVELRAHLTRLLPCRGHDDDLWHECQLTSETLESFDNLGTRGLLDDEEDPPEITITMKEDCTLLVKVCGDRDMLVQTLKVLLFILSRFVSTGVFL